MGLMFVAFGRGWCVGPGNSRCAGDWDYVERGNDCNRLDAVTSQASAKLRSLLKADNQARTRKRAIHSAAAQELARVGKHKRRYRTSYRDRFLSGLLDLA